MPNANSGVRGGASPAAATRWVVPILAASVLFYLVNNSIWLLRDGSSPSYDKAAHAGFALEYLRLFEAPTRLSLTKLLTVTPYWPPLFHISSVPFTAALGFSISSVAATNFLFLPIAVYAIFRIGQRLFDARVGAGAVVLTLLYPMVYALSREVLIDFSLLAMVALSLHLLLASDGGLDGRRSWRLGAAMGAAMLAKWTAVVFLAGPAIFWLVVCLRRDRPRAGKALAALAGAAAVFVLVAGPWYVKSFDAFHARMTREALGSDPVQEGDPTALVASLLYYERAFGDALVGMPLVLPTGLGIAALALCRRAWTAPAFLLSSILPALAFFVAIPNKDARFLLPLLPPIALVAAAGLRALPWRTLRVATWVFTVSAGVYQFYAISFGWPVAMPGAYTHAPERADWKIGEIVEALATLDRPRPVYVGVLPNDPDFEPNIFILDAAIRRLPLKIDGLGHANEPVRAWRRYDAIVSKTGSISVPYATAFRDTLRDALSAWAADPTDGEITLWKTWPLPDGSEAQVYLIRHRPAAPN